MACLERQTSQGLRWPKHQYAPLKFMFTEALLTGDAKATFNQAALGIGIPNFNKVLREMTKMHFQHILFVNKIGTYVGI